MRALALGPSTKYYQSWRPHDLPDFAQKFVDDRAKPGQARSRRWSAGWLNGPSQGNDGEEPPANHLLRRLVSTFSSDPLQHAAKRCGRCIPIVIYLEAVVALRSWSLREHARASSLFGSDIPCRVAQLASFTNWTLS